MSKDLLFICAGGYLPNRTGNGNKVLTYGLLNVFLRLNFRVTLVPVGIRCSSSQFEQDLKELEGIEKLQIKVVEDFIYAKKTSVFSAKTWMRLFLPNRNLGYFYENSSNSQLNTFVKEENVSLVYGYDWDSLGLLSTINNNDVFKVVSLVDLIDVYYDNRKSLLKTKPNLLKQLSYLLNKNKIRVAYKYLDSVDFIIEHAYQHAIQLLDRGYKNVQYIPHPLSIKSGYQKIEGKDCVTILIVGSLKGIASKLGFEYFIDQIYPTFIGQRYNLKKKYNIRVVGHGEMEPRIKQKLLKIENLEFIGFVEDIEKEYFQADIILVNIPVSQGFRTRIADAFSYGKCVVAHSKNAEGMPECKHGFNILMSDQSSDLAKLLIEAINDQKLRDVIGKNAAMTFKSHLSIDASLHVFEKVLLQ